VEPKWLLAIHVQVRLDQAAVAKLRRESAAASLSWVFSRESGLRCTLSSAACRSRFSLAVTRDAMRVVILADPAILAAVLKLVVAVQLLAVALKQLVLQHRAIADVA